MPIFESNSIILGGLRLGEADKLVTLLSEGRGKIKAVAKGARRLRNRFGVPLEPFTYCRVVYFEKKPTILLRLDQADLLNPFRKIRDNLERILTASRMVHITSALLPEGEANPEIFSLLLFGLGEAEKTNQLGWLTKVFEIRFLKHAGYQIQLDRCLGCHGLFKPGPVYFSAKNGGAMCGLCSHQEKQTMQIISPPTLSMMRLMNQIPWTGLSRIKVTPRMLNEVQALMDAHLEYILGRPIRKISVGH